MKKTFEISSSPVTASSSSILLEPFTPRSETAGEKIAKWYIEPLRAMTGSQGYLILMVLLPLYEKHLRVKYKITGNFGQDNKVFKTIGSHLQLGVDDAFLFWTHVRNGLLHRALPLSRRPDKPELPPFKHGLRENGPPIERIRDLYWINPFAMRDRLLREIEPDTRSWKDDEVGLPITADPISVRR